MPPTRVTSLSDWSAVCSEAFVPLAVRSTAPRFAATLSQKRLSGGVALTRVTSGASQVIRDSALIAASPRDSVLISLHRSGTGRVTQNGRTALITPGTAALYDTTTPYVLDFPDQMSEIVLQVPREKVAVDDRALADLTARIVPSSPGLSLLAALAAAASSPHEPLPDGDRAALAEAITSLAATILVGTTASATPAEALLNSMRTFIGDNLADPGLTPGRIAATHHVSLRTMQKLFEQDDDSVAACIRRTRLERAHSLLQAGARVADAAHRSGFHDLDTFSRAFRKQYSMTPSSLRLTSAKRV